MSRISLAVSAFFKILGNAATAERVEKLFSGALEAELATLRQEARFVDFILEPVQAYSDAQVGAAVRDIHRDCGQVLKRLFDLKPLRSEADGATVEVPAGFDPGSVKLTGAPGGQPPHRGALRHPGWVATKCELPVWSGKNESALVVAPAEVEVGG